MAERFRHTKYGVEVEYARAEDILGIFDPVTMLGYARVSST